MGTQLSLSQGAKGRQSRNKGNHSYPTTTCDIMGTQLSLSHGAKGRQQHNALKKWSFLREIKPFFILTL